VTQDRLRQFGAAKHKDADWIKLHVTMKADGTIKKALPKTCRNGVNDLKSLRLFRRDKQVNGK